MQYLRQYFDSLAQEWDGICRHDGQTIEQLLTLVELTAGDRVLDVGTGTGVLIPYIMGRVGRNGAITAIDLSSEMIRMAMKKYPYPNVTYLHGDALSCLHRQQFDCIVCYSVFPHFLDQQHAIHRLTKGLRAGGRLAILHSQSRWKINGFHRSKGGMVEHHRLPSAREVEAWMIRAGLVPMARVDNKVYAVVGKKPG